MPELNEPLSQAAADCGRAMLATEVIANSRATRAATRRPAGAGMVRDMSGSWSRYGRSAGGRRGFRCGLHRRRRVRSGLRCEGPGGTPTRVPGVGSGPDGCGGVWCESGPDDARAGPLAGDMRQWGDAASRQRHGDPRCPATPSRPNDRRDRPGAHPGCRTARRRHHRRHGTPGPGCCHRLRSRRRPYRAGRAGRGAPHRARGRARPARTRTG